MENHRGKRRPQPTRTGKEETHKFLADAVTRGIDAGFISKAESFGTRIKEENLSTSQIRDFFGSIKKMEQRSAMEYSKDPDKLSFSTEELLLLKPRLAYAAKRHSRDRGVSTLANALGLAIDLVIEADDSREKNERFRRFCQGFEAILAYHRAAGGK